MRNRVKFIGFSSGRPVPDPLTSPLNTNIIVRTDRDIKRIIRQGLQEKTAADIAGNKKAGAGGNVLVFGNKTAGGGFGPEVLTSKEQHKTAGND